METEIEKVFNRKKELIRRDPAYKEAYKIFKRIINTRNGHAFAEIVYVPEAFNDGYYAEKSMNGHRAKYPEHGDLLKLNRQVARVENKWGVLLRPDFYSEEISIVAPYTNSEVIWVGTPPLITGYEGAILSDWTKYPLINWSPYPNPFEKSPILCEINEWVTPGYNRTGEKWVPILVNVSRLNKGDENTKYGKTIKKQIWSVIKANLQKGRTKKPHDEFKECAFLYHLKDEKTFEKYLRRYDFNIGTDYNKPNGLSFRKIAFGEYVLRNHPEKYEDAMAGIAKRTKVVRTARGERVLKGVVGDHIKGEDSVEKSVKVIYNAIHRKPYPSKKTKLKEYNCPTHKASCPKDCPYLKRFMKDFNKRAMLFKRLYTTDPADLPQVIGEGRSHSKRKPTADQQSNTK